MRMVIALRKRPPGETHRSATPTRLIRQESGLPHVAMPGIRLASAQYGQAFGTNYRKPGFLARMVVAIFKVIPKFGPFKPLTPETERLFLESFERSLARHRGSLDTIRTGRLALGDADLDTGRSPSLGANPPADETSVEYKEKPTTSR
jgi:hypothetical protein